MEYTTIIVAAITSIMTLAGVIFTGWVSLKTHKKAKNTEDAVNHKQPHQLRLFDLALESHDAAKELIEWKRGYDDSPWKSGDGVQEWLDKHEERIKGIEGAVLPQPEDEDDAKDDSDKVDSEG